MDRCTYAPIWLGIPVRRAPLSVAPPSGVAVALRFFQSTEDEQKNEHGHPFRLPTSRAQCAIRVTGALRNYKAASEIAGSKMPLYGGGGRPGERGDGAKSKMLHFVTVNGQYQPVVRARPGEILKPVSRL